MFLTYKYFRFGATETITIESIKRQYRKLAMRWHPDRNGGDLRVMQEINAEFDKLKKRYYNVHEGQAKGSTYTDETQYAPDTVTDNFIEIIDKLINLDGVGIEICGSFIWLNGNTYSYRKEIKDLGARWASKKRMWFIAPADWQKRARRELEMHEIRDTYGSQVVREGKRQKRQKALSAA